MGKRGYAEGMCRVCGCEREVVRKHRLQPPRAEDHGAREVRGVCVRVEEDATLSVSLSEAEVVEDVRYLLREWRRVAAASGVRRDCGCV